MPLILVLVASRADALNVEKVAFAIGLKIFANLGNIGFFDVFVFAAFVCNPYIKENYSIKLLTFNEPFLRCREQRWHRKQQINAINVSVCYLINRCACAIVS